MSESIIYARIFPKSIKILERYNYQAEIGYTQHIAEKIDEAEKANGRIEIVIPYDGEKYFTTQAAADIQRQTPNGAHDKEVTVRIGYLAFAKFTGIGLESNPELHFTGNMAPIDLQRQEHKLPKVVDLSENPNSWRIRYLYQPRSPEIMPVKFTARIADEGAFEAPNTVWNLLDGRLLKDAQRQQLEEYVQVLAQQARISTDIIFDLQASLEIPDAVGSEDESKLPKINRVSIHWPVAVSSNHVSLHLIDKAQNKQTRQIVYNPEQRMIEWRDILFSRPQKSPNRGVHVYKTPKMCLTVDQPGELYQMPTLEGKLELEIQHAFSGLQVEYFSAPGQKAQKEQVAVESKTQITIDFKLSLSDSFAHKTLTPYQQLHFQGVVLDEMRITDIGNILAHYGFAVRTVKLNGRGEALKRYLVVGCQKQAMEQAWLWLLVEGKSSETIRQTSIPVSHIYSSQLETGQLMIHMRGQWQDDGLNERMNDIQNRLKEQFYYLSVAD